MSTIHHISRRQPSAPPVDPLKVDDARAALSALVRLYDNDDTRDREAAEEAFAQGRPAYWTPHKYHHQLARIFVEAANRPEGLKAALKEWASARHPEMNRSALALLDTLIPLNAAAIMELAEYRRGAALDLMTFAHATGRLQQAAE